jgi:HPt (histidine-containing phosphotransfer) domain-containing protein
MDLKAIYERSGLDEAEYIELLHLFVETAGAQLRQLQVALAAGDMEQIRQIAHTLKGSAGNMGLMDMHEAALRIEKDVAGRQIEALPQQAGVLAEELKTIASCIAS